MTVFPKNAGDMNFIPQNLPERMKSAYSVSNEAGMNAEELELQHKKREFIAINRGSLTLAKNQDMAEGIELGVEQGIEQGIEQNKLEIAQQMKKEGMDHFLKRERYTPLLKGARFIFLKNEVNLTTKQKVTKEVLSLAKLNLKAIRAMQIRENFQQIYAAESTEQFEGLLNS